MVAQPRPLALAPSSSSTQFHCYKKEKVNLQGVGEELVHLGELGRDAEVNCPVADLDDEPTNDIGVDLGRLLGLGVAVCKGWLTMKGTYGVLDLELLAGTNVARLGDGGLKAAKGLAVQRLFPQLVSTVTPPPRPTSPSPSLHSSAWLGVKPYLGAGDHHLDLAAGGAHELVELAADAGEEAEAVVLGEGGEEVLDGLARGAGVLVELGHDGALVGGGQGRGLEDGDQLRILLDQGTEGGKAPGGGLEGGGLDGGRVLWSATRQNGAG